MKKIGIVSRTINLFFALLILCHCFALCRAVAEEAQSPAGSEYDGYLNEAGRGRAVQFVRGTDGRLCRWWFINPSYPLPDSIGCSGLMWNKGPDGNYYAQSNGIALQMRVEVGIPPGPSSNQPNIAYQQFQAQAHPTGQPCYYQNSSISVPSGTYAEGRICDDGVWRWASTPSGTSYFANQAGGTSSQPYFSGSQPQANNPYDMGIVGPDGIGTTRAWKTFGGYPNYGSIPSSTVYEPGTNDPYDMGIIGPDGIGTTRAWKTFGGYPNLEGGADTGGASDPWSP